MQMYFKLSSVDPVVQSGCPILLVDMKANSFVGIERECFGETVGGGSFVGE